MSRDLREVRSGVGSLVQQTPGRGEISGGPGKRSLTEQLTPDSSHAIHAAAEQGIAGSSGRLPYVDQIQRAFGSHHIGDVQAHTDGAATTGARAMGAQAFATGNHVVFAGTPDLHTASHEAAHIVQQRAGVHPRNGVGEAGDPHEQQADAVADAVVQGKSAEQLLGPPDGARHTSGGALAVQRQTTNAQANAGPGANAQANLDPDANVSLGILDSWFVDAGAQGLLGPTGWTVMRELLRGMAGGMQSMPPDQRERLETKLKSIGPSELVQYTAGNGVGLLEGLWTGVKGLGEAIVTLVKLPYEVDRFLIEKMPELAAKYGPRLSMIMNEAGGLSGRLEAALSSVLHDPSQLDGLIEAFKGAALAKVHAIGHAIPGKVVDLVAEPWYDFGHDVGKVAGQVLFEVLLAVASDAIASLAKEAVSVAGRLVARLVENAAELIRALCRLLGEGLGWVRKFAGLLKGELREAFNDIERVLARMGTVFGDLAGEGALADTGTGVRMPIPDPKGSTVLESRAVHPTTGGTGSKIEDLASSKTHPTKADPVSKPNPVEDPAVIQGAAKVEKRGSYEYAFDKQGRIQTVRGELKLNHAQIRNQKAQLAAGGVDRQAADQGGHYIGRRFDGPTDDFNHFAQNGNFNQSAYKKLENEWQEELLAGKKVEVEISTNYPGTSQRPSHIVVRYWIDGVEQDFKLYKNVRGGV